MAETSPKQFTPYIPASQIIPEFTFKAVMLGSLFGILFGAVTVYLGLRAGLTVSASIPIAVLSISLLRFFGRGTILENNIVQTTGSAGESVAAGVIFTLPALIFLGFPLEYTRIFLLALIGGWLGVLFMIPLRRQLIVKEHGNLSYPEGTACADVLVAGEKGGSFAGRVFMGLGIGGVYAFLMHAMRFWYRTPEYRPEWYHGASIKAEVTPEYLGVGYIIGPKVAGTIFAGGIFSWLLMMPAIKFFGGMLKEPLYPGTIPIAQMEPDQIWASYIRPMGAGAVAAAGLITLMRTMPTIINAIKSGVKDLRAEKTQHVESVSRVENDLPMNIVIIGSIVLVAFIWALLTFMPVPGADTGLLANLLSAVLVVIFGFLFVTVSSRIVGLIGSSANPVSGMTIATLMATCALFLIAGWTGGAYAALAITIGGVVCVAAANAGATSQDLKTGFLVGATPSKQQLGLMVGVMVSVFVIGMTLILMNKGLAEYKPFQLSLNVMELPEGVQVESREFEYEGKNYYLVNAIGSRTVPDGKYLYSPETQQIEVQWIQGIGSERAAAPQARLMATVISGILNQRLPWGLVLLGVFLVVAIEVLGIRSLAFAVGSYLSIGTTLAIFCGGIVRWLAEGKATGGKGEGEVSSGSLYASGLIAGGGIFGLAAIGIALMETPSGPDQTGVFGLKPGDFAVGPKVLDSIGIGFLSSAHLFSVAMFLLLAGSLFYYAKKQVGTK
ncbi:MAG: oligopeptide transporter, OPT family [Ignavibacteriales bacterium]|nr:oligopeptide transporter, OPT family [Ignavibacteriales bacterium]